MNMYVHNKKNISSITFVGAYFNEVEKMRNLSLIPGSEYFDSTTGLDIFILLL